ncbi:hypothetical protein FZEAL_4265 [Fusarium zealandicum]|uniref:Uncharacterized protein n=1 Tax=Fusarium zealandicum TaxID=1053134 RepID=A0A8H4UMR9_9HYPO|nr:hypothetical protein FZEAL_4265 [Fusarium zealandicum]
MESNDDDATRCLPKFPKLFTTPSHVEITLYRNDLNSKDSNQGQGTVPASANYMAKTEQANVLIEALPENPLYSTLSVDTRSGSKGTTTASNPLLCGTNPQDGSSNEEIPDEAVEELSRIVNVSHKPRVSLLEGEAHELLQQQTSNDEASEADATTHRNFDQPPQQLARTHLRSIPESKLYSLGSILHRLQEDGSKAATTGSDTPRPGDLDSESMSTFDAPEPSLEQESSSYYIFDPFSGGLGYYLHQDTDVEDDFKIEKVTFKVVSLERGVSAYHVEASDKDPGASKRQSHETLWRYNHESGLAAILRNESMAFHAAEPGSNDAVNIGNEVSLDLVKKVSDRLRTIRHLRAHLHIIDDKGKQVPEANGLYLVGDKDIRDVVRIVMEEMQKSVQVSKPEGRTTKGCSGNRSLPKLDEAGKAIIPPLVTVADPATTLSLPTTSYASINATDMQVHTKTRESASDATTTVVSRRSVAEIHWAQTYPQNYNATMTTHGRTVSDCCSPTHGGLSLCFGDRRQSHSGAVNGEFVLRHYKTSKSTAEILADIICNKNAVGTPERVSDGTVITSFPKLPSRGTSDWLSPPTYIDGSSHSTPTPSTLYRQGVDAHCGNETAVSSVSHEEPMEPRQCNLTIFESNPFYSKGDVRVAEGLKLAGVSAAEKRLSASLGMDNQRRRSTQVAGTEDETAYDGLRPSLMDKIRQGSHKLFHRNHSHKSTGVPDTNAEAEETQSSSAPRSRDSILRQHTPEPPKSDKSGIYEAMTGTKLNVHHSRKDTCSEDNRPHVCADELLTPSRAGSPA